MKRPRRLILVGAVALGVAVVTWVCPLFRVVPLRQGQAAGQQADFDATRFAETFWDEQLTRTVPSAQAGVVLEAIDRNFAAARAEYGRTVGISNSYYVFFQGTGRISRVDSKGVSLTVRQPGAGADVLLPVGMVFGNTVREATGLLDMDKFPNSQDFNDLAVGLNLIVEARVLPKLRAGARVGRQVRFVGCAAVARDERQRKPLKVVPLRVEFLD
jgi:predicted lipoprotein